MFSFLNRSPEVAVGKNNRRKKKRKRKPWEPVKFSVGMIVRVKPGTMDPDFADIPLGGWTGTILEVDEQSYPKTYLVKWNQDALDQMHPVYRKRCLRDELEMEYTWLVEDKLELDS